MIIAAITAVQVAIRAAVMIRQTLTVVNVVEYMRIPIVAWWQFCVMAGDLEVGNFDAFVAQCNASKSLAVWAPVVVDCT